MKIKNLIIIIVFLWFSLPFMLISNIYPLYRYGMFAEIPQKTLINKVLKITYLDKNKLRKTLNPSDIGFSKNTLSYILRSYYYKSKSKQLLSQIPTNYKKNKNIISWQILEISYVDKNKSDTIVLYNISNKELTKSN